MLRYFRVTTTRVYIAVVNIALVALLLFGWTDTHAIAVQIPLLVFLTVDEILLVGVYAKKNSSFAFLPKVCHHE